MKIVHLVPSMESGGVEQVVMELGSGLSARGVENIVVSGGGRLIPRLEKEGSRHILMPIGKKSLATFFRIGKNCRRKTGPASSPACTAFTPSTGTPPS